MASPEAVKPTKGDAEVQGILGLIGSFVGDIEPEAAPGATPRKEAAAEEEEETPNPSTSERVNKRQTELPVELSVLLGKRKHENEFEGMKNAFDRSAVSVPTLVPFSSHDR